LTDLNPTLKQRRHGRVEEIRWTYKHGGDSSGFLVKPIGFVEGRRYPLVVQLDDNMFGPKGQPYVLDGTVQLSGHPTQMLAAEGIAVLYLRQPEWLRHVVATAAEPEEMRRYVEAGIVNLDRLGVIDPDRVGVSGWSRAAYYVARIMTRSQFPFSAATMIDGGQSEYVEGLRPFWDGELARVRAPILLQAHGPRTLVAHAFLADRLDALGKSVELLYFATASHSTTTPRHRRRSLEAHVDWWRFWLQGRRDTDPRKRAQYERWEALSLHTPHLQSR
jgi:dipeptidyl aminopeptidase/acylaminoacyl peptidase